MGMIMWELTTGYFANLMKRCWNPDPKKKTSATDVCEIFNSWSNMGMDAKYFNQAKEIRLELMKSKMLQQ
ncbi:hypothetical protein C1646_774620 [Rhizophagus diaphanus]|nr:hypothetical protein C1646_774620 [Rhizophagus diaphanus] [Rhizophagus sp. MUCL 43196]